MREHGPTLEIRQSSSNIKGGASIHLTRIITAQESPSIVQRDPALSSDSDSDVDSTYVPEPYRPATVDSITISNGQVKCKSVVSISTGVNEFINTACNTSLQVYLDLPQQKQVYMNLLGQNCDLGDYGIPKQACSTQTGALKAIKLKNAKTQVRGLPPLPVLEQKDSH